VKAIIIWFVGRTGVVQGGAVGKVRQLLKVSAEQAVRPQLRLYRHAALGARLQGATRKCSRGSM